ncbi:MAG: hypothetical protein M3301_09455 [Chloroflexota bacterium]|nr:hypothetical protein [Chloroflexota bacterium]
MGRWPPAYRRPTASDSLIGKIGSVVPTRTSFLPARDRPAERRLPRVLVVDAQP